MKFIKRTKKIFLAILLLLNLSLTLPQTASMQAVYDCGTYSSDSYNENCPEEPTANVENNSGSGTGDLSGTGSNTYIYAIVGIASVALSVGLLIASNKRSRKQK